MANNRYRTATAGADDDPEDDKLEIISSSDAYAAIVRGEVDIQISTAHRFPRSIARFQDKVRELACLNKDVAKGCTYALPRAGKELIGPSIRMAEIVASSWGNMRIQTRVVGIDASFLTVAAVCHDLETNVAVSIEVQRRITGRDGSRYNDDMITNAANSATSIALRNAVFRVVPRANWDPVWQESRNVARGSDRPFQQVRQELIDDLTATHKVAPEVLFRRVGARRIEDVTLEDYDLLSALDTSIKEGHTSATIAFAPPAPEEGAAPPKAEPEYLARNLEREAELRRDMQSASPPPPPPPPPAKNGNGEKDKAALMAVYVGLRRGFSAQQLQLVSERSGVPFVNASCTLEDLKKVVAAAEEVAAGL